MNHIMDLRILTYFLAVTREENITRAADVLHISQPSLSKQLMELEQELGKPLLIRGKRKTVLTEDGILLRKRAEEILSLVEKTERELSSDTSDISGKISIGGSIPQTLIKTASAVQKQYPGITFEFYSGDAIDITEKLDHGNLDFAVMLQPIDLSKYEYLPLPDTSIWGVLMKKDATFAEKETIQKSDLYEIPLILHRRMELQRMIADWMGTDIEQLHITATYNIIHGSPVPYVVNDLGCFLLTRDQLPAKMDDSVVFLPLEPQLDIHYNLIWKRKNIFSKASGMFLEALQENM